ncbi:MAG: CDGSH iron-sulfur domain-containing protein [Planctomycetota bacterium]
MTEPYRPQKSPYVLDMQPGRYAWCACGRSAGQPFCDGSHKGTGLAPVVVELTEAQKFAWCGCKGTANQPRCDGSHTRVD